MHRCPHVCLHSRTQDLTHHNTGVNKFYYFRNQLFHVKRITYAALDNNIMFSQIHEAQPSVCIAKTIHVKNCTWHLSRLTPFTKLYLSCRLLCVLAFHCDILMFPSCFIPVCPKTDSVRYSQHLPNFLPMEPLKHVPNLSPRLELSKQSNFHTFTDLFA